MCLTEWKMKRMVEIAMLRAFRMHESIQNRRPMMDNTSSWTWLSLWTMKTNISFETICFTRLNFSIADLIDLLKNEIFREIVRRSIKWWVLWTASRDIYIVCESYKNETHYVRCVSDLVPLMDRHPFVPICMACFRSQPFLKHINALPIKSHQNRFQNNGRFRWKVQFNS